MEDLFKNIHEKSPGKNELVEKFEKLFDDAESLIKTEGVENTEVRERLNKELLPNIYNGLILENKREKERKDNNWKMVWVWNPEGNLTEEEFDKLNLRRKILSNAVGIMTTSGEIRHDLNKI